MANDAMLLTVDAIRFTSQQGFQKRFYVVGIVADNFGKVVLTEPPASSLVKHRPGRGKPATWDFALDGYSLYHRTGGLPDIVLFHLLVVRDRSATRRAGSTIQAIVKDGSAQSAIKRVNDALPGESQSALAKSGLGLVAPVANLIGQILAGQSDRVVETISGSLILDTRRKQLSEREETVSGSSGDLEVDLDLFLFDGAADEDTLVATSDEEERLKELGLLFSVGA